MIVAPPSDYDSDTVAQEVRPRSDRVALGLHLGFRRSQLFPSGINGEKRDALEKNPQARPREMRGNRNSSSRLHRECSLVGPTLKGAHTYARYFNVAADRSRKRKRQESS